MNNATATPPQPKPNAFPISFMDNLGFVVNKVGERINREIEAVTAPHGLAVRQYGLLVLLQAEGPQAQIVLSQRVGLDRTSVMRTIDMLEERGLVRRDSNPSDRRKHSVVLTDTGAELLANTLSEVRQAERAFAVALSDQEQAQLLGLLRRLLALEKGS